MPGRLVALHGFTQTHHHLHALTFAIGRRAGFDTVVLPDLPGHGLSADDRTGIDETAAELTRRCGPGTYLGYSMGGRFALAAAVEHPEDVERLILIGATAGIDDSVERDGRRELDARRADDIERRGVAAFLADWVALPMFDDVAADDAALEHRRRNTAAGLANSLRTAGTGSMTSRWHELDRITAPTLVLAGEHDERFIALGRRIADEIPRGTFATIAGARHAAHLSRPAATVDGIETWLRTTTP